jgi:hypothetical protein
MSLLDTIRTRLTDQAVVDGSTWKCFIGYTPDAQDQVVSLNPTGSWHGQETHEGDNVHDTFQVRVRGSKLAYNTCEGKWRDMFDALQDADLSASPNFVYLLQSEQTAPMYYLDEKQRPNMTANFRVTRSTP